jgi:hypothetical protein
MKEEPTLIRLHSGPAFEPVFHDCQRAWPRTNFGDNAPDQRSNVKPAQNRARSGKKYPKYYPQNKKRMQEQNARRQCGVNIICEKDHEHSGSLTILSMPDGAAPALTYDGWEVPNPLRIDIEHGEADLEQVATDILGLTKLNYNTCKLGDSVPVTIGLSLGRWIAEAHGGSIDVESRTGAGSTFAVILPTLADRALGIGAAVG